MTVSVALGLCLQAVALIVVRGAIRGQWLRHTGALFLCVAVAFHGLTEIVQWLFPGRNRYRRLVDQAAIDDWMLWASVALLVYALIYALVVRRRDDGGPAEAVDTSSLSLPWMAVATAPLLALSLVGAGVTQAATVDPSDGYLAGGLAVQFTLFMAAIVGALAIARLGRAWMLPVLLAEVVVLSLIGARLTVLAGCLLVLYGAAIAGTRPSRRQTTVAVAVVVLLAATVSSAREVAGREAFAGQEDIGVRAQALLDGLVALPTANTLDALADQFVYRFDGNTYGAMVLQALQDGRPPVGVTTVGNTLALAVPSFVDSSKLDTSLATRSEETYFQGAFGTPRGIDYLPGVFSSWVGYGGPWVLLLLAAALAAALAALDRWVLRGSTPLVFVLGMGVVQAALFYERGTEGIVLTLRGVLVLLVVLAVIQAARGRLRQRGRSDGRASEVLPGRAV